MLSRLYDDPTHIDRVVDHLVAHVEIAARRPRGDAMTALDTDTRRASHDGVRTRTITWTDPARVALPAAAASTATNDSPRSSAATRRPPPAAALLGMSLDEVEPRPHRLQHASPTRCTRTRWARCTAASSRRSSTPRWVARCRRRLPADAGFTTLELRTNFVRAITPATGRVYAEGTRRARRRTRRHHRSTRARRRTARSTRTRRRRA